MIVRSKRNMVAGAVQVIVYFVFKSNTYGGHKSTICLA